VTFTGNLGNHMWEYAVTRSVAEFCNYEWGFNRTPSNDYLNGAEQMNFMDIDYGKEHTSKWKELPPGIDKEWTEKRELINGRWYYPFQQDIFNIQDGTKLVIGCCQDPKYLNKEKVLSWFKIKPELQTQYDQIIKDVGIDENTCVLNIRGGYEYRHWDILLPQSYWTKAIDYMRSVNPSVKFIIISDDPEYAKSMLPFNAYHFSIGCDYYIVNQAKYLIISNSSFALFPTWLNINCNFTIAPRFWGGYNFNYWLSSEIWDFNWHFLDKEGNINW
jgi:hypothetical protein